MESNKRGHRPRKSKDVPATEGMLHLVRDELKSDISGVRHELSATRAGLRSEMDSFRTEVRSEIDNFRTSMNSFKSEIKAEIDGVRSDMKSLEGRMNGNFDKVLSEIHRIGLLVEEQNVRNKYALDGYAFVSERQESEIKEIKVTLSSINKSSV